MSFIAACRPQIDEILYPEGYTQNFLASENQADQFYFGGQEALYFGGQEARLKPPAQKISYVPHLRIFLKGTASLVSSIGLTIISLIAKLVNKDKYKKWFREERKELKQTFALLGHVGMMCIRPNLARPKLVKFLNENGIMAS